MRIKLPEDVIEADLKYIKLCDELQILETFIEDARKNYIEKKDKFLASLKKDLLYIPFHYFMDGVSGYYVRNDCRNLEVVFRVFGPKDSLEETNNDELHPKVFKKLLQEFHKMKGV